MTGGLWTRLADFRPVHLENLVTERAVVRAHVMRNPVHLVAARDFTAWKIIRSDGKGGTSVGGGKGGTGQQAVLLAEPSVRIVRQN